MRLALVPPFLFLCGACVAPEGFERIETVFDPCGPLTLVPAADATAEELASIEAAIALWNDTGVVDVRVSTNARDGAPLPVKFEDAAPVFFGVYDDETAEIIVNRRLVSPTGRTITIAHELGHAFGLQHIGDHEPSVMNEANLSYAPDAGDADMVRTLWGDCDTPAADEDVGAAD